jgi:predicted nucleotidyltransferase
MGTRPTAQSRVSRWLRRLPKVLQAHGAQAAYLFGSHARGEAAPDSDIDLIVVAASHRPFVDRFLDFRDVWLGAPAAVDMLIYTPEEFSRQRRSNRFVRHVLRSARRIV